MNDRNECTHARPRGIPLCNFAGWQHPYVNVFKLCGALHGANSDGSTTKKEVEKAGKVAEKIVSAVHGGHDP